MSFYHSNKKPTKTITIKAKYRKDEDSKNRGKGVKTIVTLQSLEIVWSLNIHSCLGNRKREKHAAGFLTKHTPPTIKQAC